MDLELRGLRAFVAGSSRGLGYATAKELAKEGVNVALNGRDVEKLQVAAKGLSSELQVQVVPIPGDVTEPGAPDRMITAAVEALGGLDLLVTNAGGPPPGGFEAFDDAAWLKAVDQNLMNHVRLIRAALPHLRKSPAPSVLTITSITVKQPIQELLLSNSIRMATIGLTKSLALEMGKENIRFNSILPAYTETERVQQLMENRARANQTTVAEEIAKQAKDSPLGRMAQPAEFARVAVFLLSPAASYLTGTMLSVDGGSYKGIF